MCPKEVVYCSGSDTFPTAFLYFKILKDWKFSFSRHVEYKICANNTLYQIWARLWHLFENLRKNLKLEKNDEVMDWPCNKILKVLKNKAIVIIYLKSLHSAHIDFKENYKDPQLFLKKGKIGNVNFFLKMCTYNIYLKDNCTLIKRQRAITEQNKYILWNLNKSLHSAILHL